MTLEEMAVHYVLIDVDLDAVRHLDLFQSAIQAIPQAWEANILLTNMERQFGCYQTQEAIKQIRETLRMVLPDLGTKDGQA